MTVLKDAYKAVTGEDARVYPIGGGTYARTMAGRGVAFGPMFEGEDCRLHNADESMDLDHYMKHAEICLEAMYRLLNA